MRLIIFVIIGITIAALGAAVGAAMTVFQKRESPTHRPIRQTPPSHYEKPSRKKLVRPMATILGLSLLLLILGYLAQNVIWGAVGFVLLFFGFGVLGAFLYQELV